MRELPYKNMENIDPLCYNFLKEYWDKHNSCPFEDLKNLFNPISFESIKEDTNA